jgi:transcriptional regulator with XRE-family HTH domain
MEALGERIKKLRELKGLKQELVAEQLGMSQQSYSDLERGKTDIPFSRIEQLAKVFELKPHEIVGFDSQNVFNNTNLSSCAFNNANIHNNFPEKLQQLYEDKIKLLEEKVAWLEKR